MLSEEEKKKINRALTQTNGVRKEAALILGYSTAKLHNVIHGCKVLKDLWTTKKKSPPGPTIAEAVNGPPAVKEKALTEQERQERDENDFKTLLEETGQVPEDVTLAMSYQKLFGRHIVKVVNIMGGGALRRAQALLKHMEELDREYQAGFCGDDALSQLEAWQRRFEAAHDQYGKLFEKANNALSARAKLEIAKNAANSKKNGSTGSVSFGPKQKLPQEIDV